MSDVRIHNKLPQAVSLSVKDGNGLREITLQPNEQSEPIDKEALTEQALNLASNGHIKLRPV